MSQVKEEIRKYDPGAVQSAGHVLRRLRDVHQIETKTEMQLIQGLARVLTMRGFGVVLHITDASSVRLQVVEIARKRYYAIAKKKGALK